MSPIVGAVARFAAGVLLLVEGFALGGGGWLFLSGAAVLAMGLTRPVR